MSRAMPQWPGPHRWGQVPLAVKQLVHLTLHEYDDGSHALESLPEVAEIEPRTPDRAPHGEHQHGLLRCYVLGQRTRFGGSQLHPAALLPGRGSHDKTRPRASRATTHDA